MGLFGKKMKFEEESLAAGPAAPVMDAAPAALPAPFAMPSATAAATAAAVPGPRVAYGIDDAIRLMRTLPSDRNTDLVVRVVKQTLESLSVRVADILVDAERKEAAIQDQIGTFKNDIAELEGLLKMRRDEIARLEAELAETNAVRQKLRFADGATGAKVALVG